MPNPSPPIDARPASQIARDLQARLAQAGWPAVPQRGPSAALTAIFVRYCEIVAERLNRAPERKMLGFLQHLGTSLLPPQAARVPLTFSLAAKATEDVLVPQGTQVAAAPEPGGSPILFETEYNLVASPVRLDQLFVKQPDSDRYADRQALLDGTAPQALPPFAADVPAIHALHFGHATFFGVQPFERLTVRFDLGAALPARPPQGAIWELRDGAKRVALVPELDETAGFTRSGKIVFRDVPQCAPADLNGHSSRWLTCRCTGPFAGPLVFAGVTLDRKIQSMDRVAPGALSNGAPADLTKDLLPFGDRPKFGSTFHLATDPMLSIAGMVVSVRVNLLNPAGAAAPVPATNSDGNAQITWDLWDGNTWRLLGTGLAGQDVETPAAEFSDTTRAFTKSGQVRFRLPAAADILNLGGVKSTWLRARLTGGNYGSDAAYVLKTPPGQRTEYVPQPATLAPPWVHAFSLSYELEETGQAPEILLSENDFRLREGPPARPERASFDAFREAGPALFFGMLPPGQAAGQAAAQELPPMGERPLRFYFLLAELVRAAKVYGGAEDTSGIDWQYWNGSDWSALRVQDLTARLTRSGPVLFVSPDDWRPSIEFGVTRYWVRAMLNGQFDAMPVRRVLTNTVDARQTVTITGEILGSSTGIPDQAFRTNRRPVLDGQQLEVRERDGWTAWSAVPNFYGSSGSSRHYAIDPLTGSVRFGDGVNGQIPPAGSNNIRMARYQTGGGSDGNCPAGAIVQLKTTLPTVEKAVNWRDAEGGADPETVDSLIQRTPAILRHRGRAVSAEDFEDLARAATPEVALAKCVPLRNLAADPDGKRLCPGSVSVIIVPYSRQHRPLPSYELIQRVWTYLSDRQSSAVDLVVVGPEYLTIGISAEVALQSAEQLASIDEAIQDSLADFLDPVNGGPDGAGWSFGRQPHRSDLFSKIHSVEGVDHVETLDVETTEQRAGVTETGRFLVCPGPLRIRYILA